MKLMFITNKDEIALAAERAGVDRIFIDLETIGKQERQGGMDTVQSRHTVEDVRRIRKLIHKSELLVRVNQIYEDIEKEIDEVIEAGADILMLPYFKTAKQVKRFLTAVDGRAKTMLLFETPESVENIEEILALSGIDEVYVGINDLHLGYGRTFMFELVADGTVERICNIFKEKGYTYGFGGIARIGEGMLPAELVLSEHVHWGSQIVILARAFCDVRTITEIEEIEKVLTTGVQALREKEAELKIAEETVFNENHGRLQEIVEKIVEKKRKG